MRGAPPLRVALAPDPVWRFFVSWLCIGSVGAVSFWWASHGLRQGSWVWPLLPSMFTLAALACAAWAWPLRQRPLPCILAWDSEVWRLELRTNGPIVDGTVDVSVDLDRWMLLRFAPRGHRSPLWLPVARRALTEQDWHALRCAVYSPGPSLPPVHDR